jgi:UDP-glucose 4-epimerase
MGVPLAGRRIAVVGATGFIGSHLTEHLVRAGAHVVAVAHTGRRLANLSAVAGECRFVLSDMLDRESILACLREAKPEIVYHLAADVDAEENFEHIGSSIGSNACGTANVLEAASRAGAEVLVYADSCKVYGNGPVPYREAQPDAPVCSYAVGKAAGWQLCRLVSAMTGIAVSSVRSTFVYGPRQNPNLVTHVEDCVRRNVTVRLLGGSQTRDLLYVDDAVRAFTAAACEPAAWGHVVPIGGGVELSVVDICREIASVLSSQVEILPGAQQPRLTEIWRSYCDNAEAKAVLRWSPEVSLREGLGRTLLAAAPCNAEPPLSPVVLP